MRDDVYRNLAKVLDTLPNGFPATDSGLEIRILEKIFAPEEAELFCQLRLRYETPAQIAEQCGGFGPAMADHVSALSLKPAAQVVPGVQSFALSSGMQPAQLAATAKICLSVGYRTDDMGVALGSALLLATLGEQVYGELMGHHLAQGFGTAQRPDLALDWFDMGLAASGATPGCPPAETRRNVSGRLRNSP